jgi:uncharacterized protein (TIGR00304 family)
MNKPRIAWLPCLTLGVFLFVYGILTQDSRLYLVVVFPVIETASPIAMIGLVLIFLSGALYLMAKMRGTASAGRIRPTGNKTKVGGVLFIGPIPIVLSNDKNMGILLTVLSIVMVIIIIALFLYFT